MSNYEQNKDRFSIMRWINYPHASLENLGKSLKYIANSKSSPQQYQRGYHLKENDAFEGIKKAYRRHVPAGHRYYKHLVMSFGDPTLDSDKAMEVGMTLADYYGNEYQELLCLHTEIPKRLHCHMIMSCLNISTGKKFEQGPNEFEKFRTFFDDVMKKYDLPLLRRKEELVREQSKSVNLAEPENYYEFDNGYIHSNVWQSVPILNVPVINPPVYLGKPDLSVVEETSGEKNFSGISGSVEIEKKNAQAKDVVIPEMSKQNDNLLLVNPLIKINKTDKQPGDLIDVIHKVKLASSTLENEKSKNSWIFEGILVCPDGKNIMPYEGNLYDKQGLRMAYQKGKRILNLGRGEV